MSDCLNPQWLLPLTCSSTSAETLERFNPKALGFKRPNLKPHKQLYHDHFTLNQVEYLSGESPYLGARLVKGYIEGVHSQNVPGKL